MEKGLANGKPLLNDRNPPLRERPLTGAAARNGGHDAHTSQYQQQARITREQTSRQVFQARGMCRQHGRGKKSNSHEWFEFHGSPEGV